MFKKTITSLLFLLISTSNPLAQELQEKFADWSVFTADFYPEKKPVINQETKQDISSEVIADAVLQVNPEKNHKKVCYMISLPIKKDGNYYRRGEPYFLITNSVDNIDEITIASGYTYKEASEVELSFGLKKFNAFTYKSLAWANSKTDDIDIIKEMRRNLDVVVLGINKKNQYSSDTYSLIGFNQAYGKMKEVCDEHQ